MQIEELASRAGATTVSIGGLCLVRGADAMKLVAEMEAEDATILGIDGFTLDGEDARPAPDAMGDFSAAESAEQSAEAARRFLKGLDRKAYYFEFVLE